MKFEEAFKLGKPIKRSNDECSARYTTDMLLYIKDLLANDWEVEEIKIPITREQASKIYRYGMDVGLMYEASEERKALEDGAKAYMKSLGFGD